MSDVGGLAENTKALWRDCLPMMGVCRFWKFVGPLEQVAINMHFLILSEDTGNFSPLEHAMN